MYNLPLETTQLVFTIVRMHFVHNTLRTFWSPSIRVMVCKLGRKVRRVAFFDQGRLRPKAVFLPQCAHFAILQLPFRHMLCSILQDHVAPKFCITYSQANNSLRTIADNLTTNHTRLQARVKSQFMKYNQPIQRKHMTDETTPLVAYTSHRVP